MKLDDRPVIDQLLNPTPLNTVREVQDDMEEWIPMGTGVALAQVVEILRAEVKSLDLDLSERTLEALDDALFCAAEGVVDWAAGIADAAVTEMSERLEARL